MCVWGGGGEGKRGRGRGREGGTGRDKKRLAREGGREGDKEREKRGRERGGKGGREGGREREGERGGGERERERERKLWSSHYSLYTYIHSLLDGVQRDLTDSSRSKPANAEKRWNEVVGDLWSERLKHIREMATRFQRQSEFVLDIKTGRWGFQEWSSNEDSDTDSGSDDEEAVSPQNPSQ